MDISKKDWKLFRERLSGWQENYMKDLVKDYVNFLKNEKLNEPLSVPDIIEDLHLQTFYHSLKTEEE